MFITSIKIQNFQCYSGEYETNTFHFAPGLNIIIGDNNAGKSKLYDAFRWCIHDLVFDSGRREFCSTALVQDKIVSDKAKYEADIKKAITAKVKLCLIRKERTDLAYYELERKYNIQKTEEGFRPIGGSELRAKRSDVFFSKDSNLYEEFLRWEDTLTSDKKLRPIDADEVLSKIVNRDIEKFLWFQGEQVDSIVDFNKEDSIKAMIKQLSDIDEYDALNRAIEPACKDAENEFYKLVNRNNKNDKLERLRGDLELKTSSIKGKKKELEKYLREKEMLEQQKSRYVSRLEDSIALQELVKQKEKKEDKLKSISKEIDDIEKSYHNNLFERDWILEGLSKYIGKFKKLRDNYTRQRQDILVELRAQQKQLQRLPADVPNESYLKMMLEDCKCYLCNRDFEKGDDVYLGIENKIKENKDNYSPDTTFVFEDSFNALFNSMKYGIGSQKIKGIGDDIQEIDTLLFNKKEKKEKLIKELEKLDKEIQKNAKGEDVKSLINQGVNFERISRDSRRVDKNITELQEVIPQLEAEAKEIKKEHDKEVKKQPKDDILKQKEAKKDVLNLILDLAKNTRNRVYTELISSLQDEVNKHFETMTKGNQGSLGKVRFDIKKSFIRPMIVDDKGHELSSVNDSNIILVKLATIMGVITTKSTTLPLPLITDAPTSKFGDNYTMNFFKQVGEVFPQSVIMSYDFHQNIELRDKLLNSSDKIGYVYTITPEHTNKNNIDRNGLVTKIECVKKYG